MGRDEVDRLIADVSNAIQSSNLLTLLLPEESPQDSGNNHAYHYAKSSPRIQKETSLPRTKCLSEIPQSVLDDRVGPIRTVLKCIDAENLLDLKIIHKEPPSAASSPSHLQPLQEENFSSSQRQAPRGPHVRDGVYCHPIYDQIRPKMDIDDLADGDASMDGNGDDDDRKSRRGSSLVRYLHIAEVPDEYNIGIFVFGPHDRLPLHDHPEMCVLSRVLYGDLRRLSLDLDRGTTNNTINNNNNNHNNTSSSYLSSSAASWLSRSANWLQHNLYHGSSPRNGGIYPLESEPDSHNYPHRLRQRQIHRLPKGTRLAYKNSVDLLRAPDVASLYPYEGNLHEFVAGPHGAVVLDVLLPPYDDERKRDCTYYNIRELDEFGVSVALANNTNHSASAMAGSSQPTRQQHEALHPSLSSQPSVLNDNDASTRDRHEIQKQRKPCLIVPTGQPENFHCISGRYKGLGDADDEEELYQYD